MIGSIILLIVLIFLNAIFASAEIAVISMNDAKLKKLTEEGNKKAIKLTKLTEQPARFLATIQVVITLAGFLNSAFAADYFADPLVDLFVSLGVPIPRSVLSSVSVIIITVIHPFPWHWLVLYTRFPRSSLPWYFFLQYLPTVC